MSKRCPTLVHRPLSDIRLGIFPTTSNWSLQGPKYGNGKGKTTVLKKYCGETKMNEAKTHLLIASYDISNQEPCIFTGTW